MSFHPELAFAARVLPRLTIGPGVLKLVRRFAPAPKPPRDSPGVTASLRKIPGAQTARVFAPQHAAGPMPAMLWIHGGGMILGSPEQDDLVCATFARELGMTVIAPTYRLAPEHPFPAAMDDLYATLSWLHKNAAAMRLRTDRVVIGGASAGGGLAAGLTLMARDRGEIPVAFQLLVYPMLDDRTVHRAIEGKNHRLWTADSNRFGWSAYLGRNAGGAEVPVYAAPARATSLEGLPPAWIGVGTYDLFHDEDIEYARRLVDAGVRVELELVQGAFHGFDVFRRTAVAKNFLAQQLAAVRRAFV